MANVNVFLSEMIDIRNGFKRCHILYDDEVNSFIMDITVFLRIVKLPFQCAKIKFVLYNFAIICL